LLKFGRQAEFFSADCAARAEIGARGRAERGRVRIEKLCDPLWNADRAAALPLSRLPAQCCDDTLNERRDRRSVI
jgi:hypothetical protein